MKVALKVCFLFIGTSIGAGFSSGREIALFFGEMSPWCVALSGVFIALICGLFLIGGKFDLIPSGIAVKVTTFIAGAVSLVSMLAGSEKILFDLTGVHLLGIVMMLVGAVVVTLGIEKIKWANAVLIPLLILMMIVIFARLGAPIYGGNWSVIKPAHYAGLDVLLAGMMLSREGKKLSGKQIAITVTAIGAFMFVILFVLQNVVLSDKTSASMPVLAVAKEVGLTIASGVLIASAILTTLIGALETVTLYMTEVASKTKKLSVLSKPKNKCFVVVIALLIFYPISFLGFEKIVDTCYPFVSACGIVLTLYLLVKTVVFCVKKSRAPIGARHKNNCIKSTS